MTRSRSNLSLRRRNNKSWLSCAKRWRTSAPKRPPRKRKRQRRTSSSGARQEKYVPSTSLLPNDSRRQNAPNRTGSSADQRGSKEQGDPEGPRGKAPRFVLSHSLARSHHLSLPSPTDAIIFSLVPFFRKGKRQEGPCGDQGADRGRQAGARAKSGAGKGAPRGCRRSTAPAPATAASIPGREFKETRLQIRLGSGGQPLTTTLPSDASCVSLCF